MIYLYFATKADANAKHAALVSEGYKGYVLTLNANRFEVRAWGRSK